MWKALVLIYLVWGMNWVVMKTANGYFPPIQFVAYRFMLGAAVLLIVSLFLRLPLPERKYWPWIFMTGLLQMALNNVAAQVSMMTLGAGLAAVLNYSMPLWVAVMAHFLLGERLTLRKAGGILLSMAGMVVLMGVSSGGDICAMLIGLLSAVCWAVASIVFKLKLTALNMVQLATWQMVSGALALGVFTWAVPQGPVVWNTAAILCLLYNGVLASALAFFLWSYVLSHMEAGKASVAVLAVPAVGVIGGILFLGEALTPQVMLGMTMILGGIVMVVTAQPTRQ